MSSRRSKKPTAGVVNTYFRTDFPDVQVLILIGPWKGQDTEEFPDKCSKRVGGKSRLIEALTLAVIGTGQKRAREAPPCFPWRPVDGLVGHRD
jgi:hypothetical protein